MTKQSTMTERVRIESIERLMWAVLTGGVFAIASAVSYRPSLNGPVNVTLTILPWVLLPLTLGLMLWSTSKQTSQLSVVTMLVVIAVWLLLMLDNDNWSLFGFAIYPLCFMAPHGQPTIGLGLSALTSVAWAAGWVNGGAPLWTGAIPVGVFVVSAVMSFSVGSVDRLNREQAELIAKLQNAQQQLAASERSKGILEERTRVAAEIHDTLAQGFTSIILTSRAALRTGDSALALHSIGDTAQENLDASRRLIQALHPPELSTASLRDAINRQMAAALPSDMASELRVVGNPRPLTGAIEITMLRGAQEALLNVCTHAHANQVDVTLSYLDDAVVLDVRDDGIGFVPNSVSDRGSLTGGQGLSVLRQRAHALDGRVTIEANEGGGSVLSLLLPVSQP